MIDSFSPSLPSPTSPTSPITIIRARQRNDFLFFVKNGCAAGVRSMTFVDKSINFHSPIITNSVSQLWNQKNHNDENNNYNSNNSEEGDDNDDAALLESVSLEQLQKLCIQYSILPNDADDNYSKEELLLKLRQYATMQAEQEKQRRLDRLQTAMEEGIDVDMISKDELEGEFFYAAPVSSSSTSSSSSSSSQTKEDETRVTKQSINKDEYKKINTNNNSNTGKSNGERVVTIFNSKDTNDLTGFNLGSIPGQEFINAASTLGSMEGSNDGSVDTTSFLQNTKSSVSSIGEDDSASMEEAEEQCTLLIQTLLVRTGLPGFVMTMEDDDDHDDHDDHDDEVRNAQILSSSSSSYKPFDPTTVPLPLLQQYTQHLIAHKGLALRASLDQIELHAIGHDGMNADDVTKNGGHYREVQKVGAFLEGYRVAEVRRVSRSITSQLLDSLVSGGVRELDRVLNGMVQAGVVNDGLVLYLGDLIRQQEKTVLQLKQKIQSSNQPRVDKDVDVDVDPIQRIEDSLPSNDLLDVQTQLEQMNDVIIEWNTTKDANGRIIEETIDPNDPKVREAIMKSSDESTSKAQSYNLSDDQPAQEKILTLLQLLQKRVKAEAAFFKGSSSPSSSSSTTSSTSSSSGSSTIDHGNNLRLLAYCIHAKTNQERQQLISEQYGNSMDQLDSFLELVKSSISYTESITSQIVPAKASSNQLDLSLLNKIRELVEDLKEIQAFQAAGGSTTMTSSTDFLGGDLTSWQ